jgi:hypothetical protein
MFYCALQIYYSIDNDIPQTGAKAEDRVADLQLLLCSVNGQQFSLIRVLISRYKTTRGITKEKN